MKSLNKKVYDESSKGNNEKLFVSDKKMLGEKYLKFAKLDVVIDRCNAINELDIVFEVYETEYHSQQLKKVGICQELLDNDGKVVENIRFATFYDHYNYTLGLADLLENPELFKYIKIRNTFKNRQDNRVDLKINIYMDKEFLLEMYNMNKIPKLIYLIIIDKSLNLYDLISKTYRNKYKRSEENIIDIECTNLSLKISDTLENKNFTREPFKYQLQNMYWMNNIENLVKKGELSFKIYDLKNLNISRYYIKDIDDYLYLDKKKKAMIDLEKLNSFDVKSKGGIIADTVGLGKSFTIIGTIAQREININPDLLLAPRRLIHQWENEIKINYSDIKYITIQNISKYKKIVEKLKTDKDFLKSYDLVIVSYSFLTNKNYKLYMEEQVSGTNYFNIHSFEWNRMILDESHEVICKSHKQSVIRMQEYIKKIGAKIIWLCSGTPYRDSADICYILSFLLKINGNSIENLEYDKNTDYIHYIIPEILEKITRRNTKETVKNEIFVPEPEMDVEILKQTEIERAIYDSALNNPEKMIELCNHIMVSEEHIRILGNKPLSLQEIHKKMTNYYSKKIKKLEDRIERKTERDLVLKKYIEEANMYAPFTEVKMGNPEYHKWTEKMNKISNWEDEINEIQESIKDINDSLNSIRSKYNIFNTLGDKIIETGGCPICFDNLESTTKIVTLCGHIFCSRCMSTVIEEHRQNKCPMCRTHIDKRDLEVIMPEKEYKDDESEENVNKWGTKMARLVEYIKDIISKDKKNRFIVFSKFQNMLKLISKVLNETEIKHVFLNGSASVVKGRIRKFKLDDKIRVVLLSSEQSASGLNLTDANNIILLDTHNTNKKDCLQIEEQAIGRSVRIGQKQKVKVKRFVMENTIDEDNYKKNFE